MTAAAVMTPAASSAAVSSSRRRWMRARATTGRGLGGGFRVVMARTVGAPTRRVRRGPSLR